MISNGSRYKDAVWGRFTWTGSKPRIIPIMPRQLSLDDLGQDVLSYETRSGDELDALAQKYGNNYEDWWKLADINNIKYPLEYINSGTFLTIPQKRFFSQIDTDSITLLGK